MVLLTRMLSRITPENSPSLWMTLNAFCFGFATFLLVVAFLSDDDRPVKMFAKQSFLLFNFTTTIVWCMQAGLNILDTDVSRISRYQRIELAVAAYFLIDSTVVLLQWKFKKQKMSLVDLDTGINFIVYGTRLVDQILTQRKRHEYEATTSQHDESLQAT